MNQGVRGNTPKGEIGNFFQGGEVFFYRVVGT